MDSFKLCAAAFLCTVVAVLVRQYQRDFVLPVRVGASVLLLGFGFALLLPTLRWLETLGEQSLPADFSALLMRALGIVFLVRISAALCRDCGEPGIAACLEFAGKAELLLLCIPLLDRLLTAAGELMTW